MSSRRRQARFAAILPGTWLLAFVLAPLVIVAKISLSASATAQPPYRPHWPSGLDPAGWAHAAGELGLDNYRALADDPLYRDALLSSLTMAGLATAIALPLGFGMALAVARAPRGWQAPLLAAVTLPFWTSFLVRVYAWIAILKAGGWLDASLTALGVPGAPFGLLDTPSAALIGLVYAYLPFTVLPLYGVLERQDPTLAEAAFDLGASRLRVFWTVTVPLAWPGIVSAALLCFIPMVGEFVIPELLGGSGTLMLGRTLWAEFFSNRDWPLAAAVATVLLAILALPVVVLRAAEERRSERAR